VSHELGTQHNPTGKCTLRLRSGDLGGYLRSVLNVKHPEYLCAWAPVHFGCYRGAAKSLARPTSLSVVFSVQGKGGSPTGPDPENVSCTINARLYSV
jgi:hypothetical protein